MNKLDAAARSQVINCLIEGCSTRSTVRMTGVAKKTVMRLLGEVGAFCLGIPRFTVSQPGVPPHSGR